MTGPAMPDRIAATYAAALAVRQLVRFGEAVKVVDLHDAENLLGRTDQAMPSAMEIASSYTLLLRRAAAAATETAAAELTALALVEAILVDHANGREPAAPEEAAAVVEIVRRLRQGAHSAMLAALVAGKIAAQEAVPAASGSVIALVKKWRETMARLESSPAAISPAALDLADEVRRLEAAAAETPSRGDADLIAKAEMLHELIDLCPAHEAAIVERLTRSLLEDIMRIVGGGR